MERGRSWCAGALLALACAVGPPALARTVLAHTALAQAAAIRPPLAIGVRLPPVFLTPGYAIASPGDWSLPEPDQPLRWVRYYDDAALVDTDGVVRDVRRLDWSVAAPTGAVIITGTPIAQPVFPPAPVPPPVLRPEPVLAVPTGTDPRCHAPDAPAPGRNPYLIGPCPYDAPGVAGYAVNRPTVTTVTIDEGPLVTTTTTTTYYDNEDVGYVDEDGYQIPPPRARQVIRRPR